MEKRKEYVLVFNILRYLIKNKISKMNIYDLMNNVLKIDFSNIKLERYNIDQVLKCDDYVYLRIKDIEAFEKIPYFLAHYYRLKNNNLEELLFTLQVYCERCNDELYLREHICYIMSLIFAIDFKSNSFEDDYYIAQFVYNYLSIESIVNVSLNEFQIINFFENENINTLIDNENILKLFTLKGITTFLELSQASIGYKLLAFLSNYIQSKKILENYTITAFSAFNERLKSYLFKLTPREEQVIFLRNGLDGTTKTLEEIGELFNVTRERIRQIEKKALKRLLTPSVALQDEELLKIYFKQLLNGNDYIKLDTINEYFGESANIFIGYLLIFNMCEKYERYGVITKNKSNINVIMDTILGSFDNVYSIEQYEQQSEFNKKVINSEYYFNGQAYFKNYRNKSEIIVQILKNNFNNQFNSRNDDLEKINNILEQYYVKEKMNKHNFISILDRMGYYNIGNGIYKKSEDFPIIPNDLLNNIVDYINSYDNAVLYSLVYDHFKDDLEFLGIDNTQYFKSVIDIILKDEFNASKAYIYKKTSSINAIKYMLNTFHSFDGVFELRDVIEKLPQYSIISLKLNIERELKKKLLIVGYNKYIYANNVAISKEVSQQLLHIIEDKIEENNGVITINQLYVELYYNYSDILVKLDIFNDAYSLFSLGRYLFGGKFNFRRPWIFDSSYENMNLIVILNKNLSKYNEISFDDIRDEFNKYGLVNRLSRMELLDILSEVFILVDENRFINLKNFSLSATMIDDIRLTLNLYLRREKELDSSVFSSYNLFPKLKYRWNKSLLLGIIKVYLNSEYESVKTTTSGDLNYVVRRLINE